MRRVRVVRVPRETVAQRPMWSKLIERSVSYPIYLTVRRAANELLQKVEAAVKRRSRTPASFKREDGVKDPLQAISDAQ